MCLVLFFLNMVRPLVRTFDRVEAVSLIADVRLLMELAFCLSSAEPVWRVLRVRNWPVSTSRFNRSRRKGVLGGTLRCRYSSGCCIDHQLPCEKYVQPLSSRYWTLFKTVVSTEDVGGGTRLNHVYLWSFRRLGTDKATTWFLEDALFGAQTAFKKQISRGGTL